MKLKYILIFGFIILAIIFLFLFYPKSEESNINVVNKLETKDTRLIYDGNVMMADEFWANIVSLVGKQITIEGIVGLEGGACTKKNCGQEDPCCNDCYGELVFKNINGRNLLIKGEYKGEKVGCGGNECNFGCFPLEKDKRYKIKGIVKEIEPATSFDRFYLELKDFELIN